MIYLDNAATTPVNSLAAVLMADVMKNDFFNPSSLYTPASALTKRIDAARKQIADILSVKPDEIYFTSGATESNNLAVFSGFKNKNGNIIVSGGEHASVYEAVMTLKNKGTDVRFAPLKSDGTVNEEKFLSLIDSKTSLISLIHRSNETGAVNNIAYLSEKAKEINKNLLFHSDGVQAFGKAAYKTDMKSIDLYSVSAHKVGGPKGAGAIFIKKSVNIQPYIFGGGQEKNMRSGTENTAAIIGFGQAAAIYAENYSQKHISRLNQIIQNELICKNTEIISNTTDCGSNIISLSVLGVNAEILQRLLCSEGILIGLGSACASKLKTNRVLSEMGLSQKQIAGSIRLSTSPQTTEEEILFSCKKILEAIAKIKGQAIG